MSAADGAGARLAATSWRHALLAALCFTGLALWAYHGALDAPFVLDDEPAIVDNPRNRELLPRGDANYAVQSTDGGRPLVRLTLALNYALGERALGEHAPLVGVARAFGIGRGGLDPRGYHVFNLALQVLSALVLYGLVWRTLARACVAGGRFAADARALALVVAALWLVHPLQTDAVTYTIQRTELLMGLCLFATLYAALRAFEAFGARRAAAWTLASVAACALGMLSKEAMAAAPLLVMLYDRAFLFRSWREALARRRALWIGLASTWGVLAWIVALGARDKTVGFGLGVPWWRYLATQGGMVLHYLRLAFWPEPLCLDYGRALAHGAAEIVPGALVVGGLALATLWALRARPQLGFLGAWFFGILAPSSSIVPIVTEVGAERRMHAPLAAVVVAFVLALHVTLHVALTRLRARRVLAPLAVVALALVALLATLTLRRNADYASELSIWQDTVEQRPENPGAHNNLGRALAHLGRFDEAAREFTAALALPDCPPDALVNLGNVLTDLGRLDEADAHLQEVLRLEPESARVHEAVGGLRMRQERWAEAVAEYQTCIAAGHRSADIHSNLGKALYKLGRVDEAIAEMRAALALDPHHAIAARNLALVEELQKRGQ